MKNRSWGILIFAAVMLCGAELPAGVPKGATEAGQGRYRFIDKDKKVWIYRMTPFGVQRFPEETAKADSARPADGAADQMKAREAEPPRTETPFGTSKASAAGMPATTATEAGDSIRFERPSPFGVYRWTKKKSELTADERKLWEEQQNAPARANKQ
jgi:hypothetical protein